VGRAIQALHQLSGDAALGDGTARAVRAALLRLQRLQQSPGQCPPLLRALAQRVAGRHPDQARQLRHAAHEIAQHQVFFRNAG
jgi:hypothetical protein